MVGWWLVHRGTPGRTSNPLQSTKSRARHAKATGRAAEPKGRQAYIQPLGEHQAPRLLRISPRQGCGDQTTPGRTSEPLAEHQGSGWLVVGGWLVEEVVGGWLVVDGWLVEEDGRRRKAGRIQH